MGAIDKFMKAMTIDNSEDDDEYMDSEFDDSDETVTPGPKRLKKEESSDFEDERPKKAKSSPFKASANAGKRGGSMRESMEIYRSEPASYDDDAPQIADALLRGCTVVLNVEGIQETERQRILDFTFGACYALKGRYQQISKFVYIITPESVSIYGDSAADEGV